MAEGEILRFPALQKSVNQFIEEQKNKQTLSKARRNVGLLSGFLKSKQEKQKNRRDSITNWVSLYLLLLFIVTVSTVVRS